MSAPTEDHKPGGTGVSAAIAPVMQFLSEHAPFDRLEPAHREFLGARLRLGFHPQGAAIADPAEGVAARFYIIKQGRVRGEAATGVPAADAGVWELVAGECFPVGAMLGRRPVRTVHRAVEDSFCFEIDRVDFEWLHAHSPVFRDFCARRLAHLLDQALARVQVTLVGEVSAGASLNASLASLVRRLPVTCTPGTPLREALGDMQAARVGSIVVVDADYRPLGIFTLHDLLARVVTSHASLDVPIEQVMTPHPLGLPPQASAHEAAAMMARDGVGHLCVMDGNRLVGVISERDLFSLQRVGLVNLARSITLAPDAIALTRLNADVQRFVRQMMAHGASVTQVTQLITLLNDHVTQRVVALALEAEGGYGAAFTWLAFGSEGRQEQTFRTDQDNGMLFLADARDAVARRERLLPLARRINRMLADVGLPLCPGNIMAGNPECCLSFDEWHARFAGWIEQGGPEELLKASIFFDFRPLHGDAAPASELRQSVMQLARRNERFLRQLAQNALSNRPPLGLMGDFETDDGGGHGATLDLKLRGTMPFVDGARLLALAHGISETNTILRFHAAARLGVVPREEAEAWSDAYAFLQLLRLRRRVAADGEPLPGNRLDPNALNELDQRILKEVFRQARKLQARIALDYQL